MSALVVVGAGPIGAATVQQAAARALATRITLVDPSGEAARGLALDLCQSGAVTGTSTLVDGTNDIAAVMGARVVVVADRFGGGGEWTGDDALRLAAEIRALNARALLVMAGPSHHTAVERLVVERDGDGRRVAGSAPEALRSGMTALAALEAGVAARDVGLAVLGHPPRDLFVAWEGASIGGAPAADVLTPPVVGRLDGQLPYLWPPGPLALGAAAAHIARLALAGAPGVASAFVVRPGTGEGSRRGQVMPIGVIDGSVVVRDVHLAPRDRVRFER